MGTASTVWCMKSPIALQSNEMCVKAAVRCAVNADQRLRRASSVALTLLETDAVPKLRSLLLLASAFARGLRLGHPFPHLRFDRIEIEACAPLHRGIIEEGLEFLAHYLLDEHETPELE